MMHRRTFNNLVGLSMLSVAVGPVVAQSPSALERIKKSGVLRIGGIPDGAPYYQKGLMDGKWQGFYIDICQKLANDLGLKLQITETTWGNSVLDLQSNKIDVFFGLNPTPERQKIVDFSGPVFKNAYTLVANEKVQAVTWDDLNNPNLRVSVDAGSSHDAAMTKHAPNAQISRLKTQSDATVALQSGRVDAQCLVIVLALTLRAKLPKIGKLIIPTPADFTTSNAGFRREEDQSWRQFVDQWITTHRDNGFIKDAIVRNMALVGVKESDFPAGFEI